MTSGIAQLLVGSVASMSYTCPPRPRTDLLASYMLARMRKHMAGLQGKVGYRCCCCCCDNDCLSFPLPHPVRIARIDRTKNPRSINLMSSLYLGETHPSETRTTILPDSCMCRACSIVSQRLWLCRRSSSSVMEGASIFNSWAAPGD